MRILVEPSDYVLRNFGDMAMLQAAVGRLADVWPEARIDVMTNDPERLVVLCPAAHPLPGRGRELWPRGQTGWPRASRRADLRSRLRTYAPRAVACFRRLRRRDHGVSRIALGEFREQFASANLVLVAGMGGITDAFPEYATGVLERLRLALSTGDRPVVMMGQGFGPLERPDLRRLAADVLPRLQLIGVREKRASVPLLRELQVPEDRIVVTGDDALEMAHAHRSAGAAASPDGLGVNFRVASYSGSDDTRLASVAAALRAAAARRGCSIIPVPISSVPGEEDLASIRRLLPVDDEEILRARALGNPAAVVAQLNRCRVLVTGSYHAAVFALAIGVPAIGLAASRYYEDKFYGLVDMFGVGCAVLNLRSSRSPREELAELIDAFWKSGPELKPRLISAAVAQIEAGRNVYEGLRGLVEAAARSGPARGSVERRRPVARAPEPDERPIPDGP